MMGHLVFGRYGTKSAGSSSRTKGWIARLWRNLFAHAPAKAHSDHRR